MNLKKIFSLGFIIGVISLFGSPMRSQANEYQEGSVQMYGEDYERVVSTTDGGYVILFSSDYPVVVKYSKDGDQEWLKTLENDSFGYVNSIIETSDEGFVIVGEVWSSDDSNLDGIVIKLDKNGNQEWSETWGGSEEEQFVSIVEMADKGFIVAGQSWSIDVGIDNKGGADAILLKYDKDGKQEWIKSWGGSSHELLYSAVKTIDNGIVVVGQSNSTDAGFENKGGYDGVILKYDINGERKWMKTIGGDDSDELLSVATSSDGGFVGVGRSYSTNFGFENKGDDDAIIVKWDKEGNWEWLKSWGGSEYESFHSVIGLSEGGIIVSGVSESSDAGFDHKGDRDGILMKFTKDGNQEWIESWGGSESDGFYSMAMLSDGSILLVGSSSSEDLGFEVPNMYVGVAVKYIPIRKDADIQINGTVETMIADVTIPSVSPDLVINPNLPEGSVSPEFSVSNDSVSPIKLELKTFEQTTDTFNDVLPTKYDSWVGLNKQQSQDIALGLIAKEGEGWQTLTTPNSYVANHAAHEIGIIKPTSSVDFSFDVKHGTAFSEAKTVQYKMVFVFDLMN